MVYMTLQAGLMQNISMKYHQQFHKHIYKMYILFTLKIVGRIIGIT